MSKGWGLSSAAVVEQRPRLALELAIFRGPVSVERSAEDTLKLGPRLVTAAGIEQRLGEEEVGRRALRVIRQGLTQVRLGLLPAAAEESWDLEVPAPERAVRRPLLKSGVELQHGQ